MRDFCLAFLCLLVALFFPDLVTRASLSTTLIP